MPTPIRYEAGRGDLQAYKDIWIKKISEAEDRVDDAHALAQRQTENNALLEVRRQYYDFLIESNLMKEAEDLLTAHPEIERREAAAA